jgi:DNA-binding NtrC family response regulator
MEGVNFRDTVLILEEDAEFRSQVRNLLKAEELNIELVEAETGEEAWNHVNSGKITVALVAFSVRDMSALDLLYRINLHRLSTKVVIISDPVRAHDVVEHIRAGAYDFLERPFPPDQLLRSVEDALKKIRQDRIDIQNSSFEDSTPELIGSATSIKAICDMIGQVAPTNSTILITGESGTGKEVAARSLHRKSKRNDKPFIVVDCGTIPANLVESELFGYVSGAFTGATGDKKGLLEQANHGTAFFDEVGEFPLDLQVKLLRVIQDGEVRRVGSDKVAKLDLRVIAATNKELENEVRLGRFRQDLYYRLNVVNVQMPPLRERAEDIEAFVHYFLKKYQREYDHCIRGITLGSMAMLKNYQWPGNVRELEHTIMQLMALHNRKAIIEERDLPMFLERRGQERKRRYLEEALDLKLSLDDYAREFVRMFESEYTEKELAASLGITTKTLWQKRRKWGLARKKRPPS